MNKFWSEFSGLVWTLAGTALVLITLSGTTRTLGILISAIALVLNFLAIIFGDDE